MKSRGTITRIGSIICSASLIVLFAVTPATSQPESTRNWRYWPFSQSSPWNVPIGSGAVYKPVSALTGISAGMNYNDRWTSAIIIAADSDPLAPILFGPASGPQSMWNFLANGGKTCRNDVAVEAQIKIGASPLLPPYPANYYSTLATPDTTAWLLPNNYQPASLNYQSSAKLPLNSCPSPDTDALMAVFQPDGRVLDTVNTVVTSDGLILTSMASYVDARGDGTGYSNGRRASMIPSFAGLIRKGEIKSGRIPHALAALGPASLLKTEAAWPAFAFDRNAGYSGSLPMGALLAIPPNIDVRSLGLSPQGTTIARAAQDYGVYLVDRGGSGLQFLAELGDPEIHWEGTATTTPWWQDLEIIKNALQQVVNNSAATPGGGGVPRVPLAPPFVAPPRNFQIGVLTTR
jgi:hypothetical protein